MKYQNVVVPVYNYATSALQETLTRLGEKGYRFVNSVMADNKYGCKGCCQSDQRSGKKAKNIKCH